MYHKEYSYPRRVGCATYWAGHVARMENPLERHRPTLWSSNYRRWKFQGPVFTVLVEQVVWQLTHIRASHRLSSFPVAPGMHGCCCTRQEADTQTDIRVMNTPRPSGSVNKGTITLLAICIQTAHCIISSYRIWFWNPSNKFIYLS